MRWVSQETAAGDVDDNVSREKDTKIDAERNDLAGSTGLASPLWIHSSFASACIVASESQNVLMAVRRREREETDHLNPTHR